MNSFNPSNPEMAVRRRSRSRRASRKLARTGSHLWVFAILLGAGRDFRRLPA